MMKLPNNDAFVALLITLVLASAHGQRDSICPGQELILPCRCSQKGPEIQIWCSHSDLPRVLAGIKAVAQIINRPIDELILENNYLPSLPGRAFANLQITRLMLRHNGLERLSSGWLNDLENSLVEIFIVERDLRGIPVDSILHLHRLEAITIQSENLKRTPDFAGLQKLRYVNIQSASLIELSALGFRDLHNLETIIITGSEHFNRLEAGLFLDLPKLKTLSLQENGIDWIHMRAITGVPSLQTINLSFNKISNVGMIGRAVKDIPNLEILHLNNNLVSVLSEGSFVDLPSLKELHINDNVITDLLHGAFHRTPSLKLVHLENNYIRHVHPESFLQSSGKGVEIIHLQNNDIGRVEELRSLLDALPMLRYLDISYNRIEKIPFGALRGHGSIEQLQINHNGLRVIERDAIMAMPMLRELRLKNNSLTDLLPMPFWNLPALKGLNLANNKFRRLEPTLLVGLPSLRRLDISENSLSVIDPSTFLNTGMLETVNISRNDLTTLHPATFHNLNYLFELDASDNSLVEMINGLPHVIERINLRGNKIASLPASSKSFDLPNLRMLDLSNNILNRVPKLAFTMMPQLRWLGLARNRLQTVDEATLLGLNLLEVLDLSNNVITKIHDQSTTPLMNLRELNVQGNQLQSLGERVLEHTPKLERLDASKNKITELTPGSFNRARSLQMLDLSSNSLRDLPESLQNLKELREIDVSFNEIASLTPDAMKSWLKLEEFRASNNKISGIRSGTFRSLPLLQYLDLSSNDLSVLDPGSVRNLPEIQEIVLADNRLIELRDRIFEDLPNLQAIHLQQNNLRAISPIAFYNSPSVLYLNLSTNNFNNLENVGLRNVRNLEVLDLSNNEIRRVTSNPLRGLDWLVELKLNDNRICRIQGEPFSSMPRLRVLSMRNNRMTRIRESSFRNLRGNIAILDVDGNPIECSCEMLWLRAWLQETGAHYPGPRCRDGTMLRDLELSRQSCDPGQLTQERSGLNKIPLTNEHGDTFLRHNNEFVDECGPSGLDGYDDYHPQQYSANIQPSPGESEYFYDQYVDYPNNNETKNGTNSNKTGHPPYNDFVDNKFTQYHNNLHNSPGLRPTPPSSQFTFFGMPIPSLSLGNVFGNGRTANSRGVTAEGNSIGGSTRGKGRVQIYRPGDPELQVIINKSENDIDESTRDSLRDGAASNKKQTLDSNPTDKTLNNFYRPYFQTKPFNEPQSEKGGFTPMIPGVSVGGFMPINPGSSDEDEKYHEKVPLVEINSPKRNGQTILGEITKVQKSSFSNNEVHLTSSISPILSTLSPQYADKYAEKYGSDYEKNPEHSQKTEFVTEIPSSSFDEIAKYEENMNRNKQRDEYKYSSQEIVNIPALPTSTSTSTSTSSPSPSIDDYDNISNYPELTPTIVKSSEIFDQDELLKAPEPTYTQPQFYDQANQSTSSLSALVAPGSVVSQNLNIPQTTNGFARAPPIAGKGKSTITKVFSPAPPTMNDEIPPHPLFPAFQSSPSPQFDSEFQSNQIYTQTVNEHDKFGRQYERDDMDWYFSNYNNTQSTPMLNYNFQSPDIISRNSYRSGANIAVGSWMMIVVGLTHIFMFKINT